MTIPNIITLMRVVLVPVIVWALLSHEWMAAFVLFLVAGASDAVDGAIARTFNQQSELGTMLDPIADKVMLVSVFIVLGYLGSLPIWLTILVVSRDVLIVSGILICFMLGQPATIHPIWVSKATTLVQILLALLVLWLLAFELQLPLLQTGLEWLTAVLSIASAIAYVVLGVQHLSAEAGATPTDEFNEKQKG